MPTLKLHLARLQKNAFEPVDIASLVFFRIAFGLIVLWQVWSNFAHHAIYTTWLAPRFLFKYYGFAWVHPWPGNGLYLHWAAFGFFALLVAIGFFYRANIILLFLSCTYFFLLEEARFVNHNYLLCLFSFLLIFVPANRALSVDVWLKPKIRSQTSPAWTLWLLRAQIGVVYFFSRPRQTLARLASWRTNALAAISTRRFSNPQPAFPKRMGSSHDQLQRAFARLAHRAALALASHQGPGLLRCGPFSSSQRALV